MLPDLTEVLIHLEKTIQNPQSPPNSCPILPSKHSSHLREGAWQGNRHLRMAGLIFTLFSRTFTAVKTSISNNRASGWSFKITMNLTTSKCQRTWTVGQESWHLQMVSLPKLQSPFKNRVRASYLFHFQKKSPFRFFNTAGATPLIRQKQTQSLTTENWNRCLSLTAEYNN